MDKSWLIETILKDLGDQWVKVTKKEITFVINSLGNVLLELLSKWHTVTVHNLAKFSVTQRKARKGYSPPTGKTVMVAAHKTVHVRIAARFKKAINNR